MKPLLRNKQNQICTCISFPHCIRNLYLQSREFAKKSLIGHVFFSESNLSTSNEEELNTELPRFSFSSLFSSSFAICPDWSLTSMNSSTSKIRNFAKKLEWGISLRLGPILWFTLVTLHLSWTQHWTCLFMDLWVKSFKESLVQLWTICSVVLEMLLFK